MEKPQALPLQRRPATNQRHALPPKRRGEIAELAFMQKAVSLGFAVAKPWGDSERYDYILDAGGRFWRVQVRSTAYESYRGYAVHTYIYEKRKMVALTADDIDCIVAYIVPLDLWYVLPVESFSPCKNLWFYPTAARKDRASKASAKPGGCWLRAWNQSPRSRRPRINGCARVFIQFGRPQSYVVLLAIPTRHSAANAGSVCKTSVASFIVAAP